LGPTLLAGLSIYFHPEALPAFSEIAQKLPSTSFIPENLQLQIGFFSDTALVIY